MPGAGFLRKAEVWKKKMEDFVDFPYEFVKNAMVSYYMRPFNLLVSPFPQKSGNYKPSFCSTLLEDVSMQTGESAKTFEFDLKWSANSMYSGSIDTVS